MVLQMEEKKANLIKNIILTVLMVAVGVVLSVQFRSVRSANEEAAQAQAKQLEEYKQRIEELGEEIADLQSQYEENNAKYQQLLSNLAANDSSFYGTLKSYHDNIDSIKYSAGLTDISGQGIIITLADSAVSGDKFNSSALVHDSTLLNLVNQLKMAGAQAISVNDERIVAMSEFICVGPAVRVNGTKLFAPFTIKAVGNPAVLEAATKASNAVSNPNINVSISVSRETEVTVSAYNKSYKNSISQLKNYEG